MKARLFVVLLSACGSRGATHDPPAPSPVPTPTETEVFGVVFERMLFERDVAPLFGPDGSVTVHDRRWTADGAYAGPHMFARAGQLRPVAIAGTPDAPRVVALGWSELDDMPDAPPAEDRAWLVIGDVTSDVATSTTAVHHEFLGDNNVELSPDGTSLVTIERTEVVIRHAATGIERARHPLGSVDEDVSFPDAHHVCWLDDEHVAWIGTSADAHVLRVAAVHGAIATTPLAQPTTIVACDPAGDAAAIALPGSVAVLDLANATVVAAQAVDDEREYTVAIGARGQRLAIATNEHVTLYRRDGGTLTSVFEVASNTDEHETPLLAFTRDGRRLAITGPTLLVIGDTTNAPPALATVLEIALDLPRGFVDGESIDVSWRHGQLPVPSGRARTPALLFQARDDDRFAHVIGLAVDRAELPSLPADNDDEMKAFAKRAMARWFESWQHADLEADDYTIAVGRTNGMRWFETRELHRDGCEPYDAYTRVVIDTHFVYVVRAITVPGGSIDGWLAPFFDAPLRAHAKTALRKGTRSGPC